MLKINFVDFWPNFHKTDNYFYHLLSTKHSVSIDESHPDLIFCSCYGNDKKHYENRAKIIFFSGENRDNHSHYNDKWTAPDINYDLTLTQSVDYNTNVNLPLFVLFLNWFNIATIDNRDISHHIDIDSLINPRLNIDDIIAKKTKLCSFIVGNPNSKFRIEYCKQLQEAFHVDCPGKVLNNMQPIPGRGDTKHKVDFLIDYKFNIAFENSINPGYITEKILHPLAAWCIPIYHGSDCINDYFNKDAFINSSLYSINEIVTKIQMLNNDKDAFIHMISLPKLLPLAVEKYSPSKVLSIIEKIL